MGGLKNTRARPDGRCVLVCARFATEDSASPCRKSCRRRQRPLRPLWAVVLAAGLIVGVAMGLRQVMGLYLPPMTAALGIGVEPFSTSMAVADLIWGIGAVFAGMVADRYGAGRVVVGGILATIAGIYVMYAAQSGYDLIISGVLLGIGVSGPGSSPWSGPRAAPRRPTSARRYRRVGMAAGIGGFVAFPYTHVLMDLFGWQTSLLLLPATTRSCCRSPGRSPASPAPAGTTDTQSLVEAFREAVTHPSYLLLNTGFFVCGFHVAFYGVHLPRFVADNGLDPSVGVIALTWWAWRISWHLHRRAIRALHREAPGLSLIYFGRCFIFLGLLFLPITPDRHRAQHRARPVLAVDGAADLGPGRHLLRHPLDVDAVRGGVPVAPARLVLGAVARRLSLRCHQVL